MLLKENFKLHNKDINQYYNLYLMESLPNEKEHYEEGNMYVEKKGDKVNFVAITHDRLVINGTLDLNIDGDLTSRSDLRRNKNEILKKTSEMGVNRNTKKGLSYEEWKKSAFSNITTKNHGHYVVLTNLLEKLGIQLPMTLESLNF